MQLEIRNQEKNVFVVSSKGNKNYTKIVDEVILYTIENNCSELAVDLTTLNPIDCIKVGTLIATRHFALFIEGKVSLIVNDTQAKDSIEMLSLSNIEIIETDTADTLSIA